MKNIRTSSGATILIDYIDYEAANQIKWWVVRGYAQGQIGRKKLYMHRWLLEFPEYDIDHINGNRLDNRRSNLRICTESQNLANQRLRKNSASGYKGVTWRPDEQKFRVRIMVNGRSITIGQFSEAEDAAHAYDKAAVKYFGEFAKTNF